MNEIINLAEYSDEELLSIVSAVRDECVKRSVAEFPHKVGDCFFRVAPASLGRGLMICRITSMEDSVECDILNIDACNNSWKSSTSYGYKKFCEDWTTPISPSVFDLYKEKVNKINAINNDFVRQVIKLKDEKHLD